MPSSLACFRHDTVVWKTDFANVAFIFEFPNIYYISHESYMTGNVLWSRTSVSVCVSVSVCLPKLVLDLATPEECKAELTSWLVTYRDGIPAQRRSPIQVLTGPAVE